MTLITFAKWFAVIALAVIASVLFIKGQQYTHLAYQLQREKFEYDLAQAREKQKLIDQCMLERYGARAEGLGWYYQTRTGTLVRVSNTVVCLDGWEAK